MVGGSQHRFLFKEDYRINFSVCFTWTGALFYVKCEFKENCRDLYDGED